MRERNYLQRAGGILLYIVLSILMYVLNTAIDSTNSGSSSKKTYEITCNQCNKTFLADDYNVNKICGDCFSAVRQEQINEFLEENPDLMICGKDWKVSTYPSPDIDEIADEGLDEFLHKGRGKSDDN